LAPASPPRLVAGDAAAAVQDLERQIAHVGICDHNRRTPRGVGIFIGERYGTRKPTPGHNGKTISCRGRYQLICI
jgi:hypothetical protein